MATHIRFGFGDTQLAYSIRDNSGEREMRVDYSDIPRERRRVFERNTWLRNVGLIWCAIGLVALIFAIIGAKATIATGFWLIIGIGSLAFYKATQTNYTVFDTEAGSIWIAENAEMGRILDEIASRRKARLIALYGAYNSENDAARELGKYDWLVEQGALTREEADQLIAIGRSAIDRPDGEKLLSPPDQTLH